MSKFSQNLPSIDLLKKLDLIPRTGSGEKGNAVNESEEAEGTYTGSHAHS